MIFPVLNLSAKYEIIFEITLELYGIFLADYIYFESDIINYFLYYYPCNWHINTCVFPIPVFSEVSNYFSLRRYLDYAPAFVRHFICLLYGRLLRWWQCTNNLLIIIEIRSLLCLDYIIYCIFSRNCQF